ncbi:DUF6455 family protein [Pseudotabrizicola sp. L79]|uniref:DUF6455 family protein n=1 Tax=Pseudotabrizicola sp. L79 TaxID=3118402 RepID=UPI002F930336
MRDKETIMLHAIKALISRRRQEKAVEALSAADLADLGMTRDTVLHFLRMPADAPDRVLAMGRVFGLSEGGLKQNRSDWLDMVETCAACPDRAACALVLSKGALANPRDAAFCPNTARFTAHWAAA